jgi:predicted Ser/Thr protein kinase
MLVVCFKQVTKIHDSGYKSNWSNKLVLFNYIIIIKNNDSKWIGLKKNDHNNQYKKNACQKRKII